MAVEIDTKQIAVVRGEVQSIYQTIFPQGNNAFVPEVFGWAQDCFTGKHHDYQSIDARYHDLEHTLQGTLCMARLLRGWHFAQAEPVLTQSMFELGVLAILLHDTGYLKKRGDNEGTGAKYTLIHVDRSRQFAEELMSDKKFSAQEIKSVQNMICCTGINVDLCSIPFQNDVEQRTGFALGTADLLGQMAAKDYIEKLPILYSEFAEAARYNTGKTRPGAVFTSAEDLLQKTPFFWEKFVRPKIENDFQGVYRFLNNPYPDGENFYIDRIEQNIFRLRQQLQ
ncbi:MAG: hypothetical protein ABIR24_13400 [Verrucomicrobiota bacterium]